MNGDEPRVGSGLISHSLPVPPCPASQPHLNSKSLASMALLHCQIFVSLLLVVAIRGEDGGPPLKRIPRTFSFFGLSSAPKEPVVPVQQRVLQQKPFVYSVRYYDRSVPTVEDQQFQQQLPQQLNIYGQAMRPQPYYGRVSGQLIAPCPYYEHHQVTTEQGKPVIVKTPVQVQPKPVVPPLPYQTLTPDYFNPYYSPYTPYYDPYYFLKQFYSQLSPVAVVKTEPEPVPVDPPVQPEAKQ